MDDSLAGSNETVGIVLAAGAGTRLRPLTDVLPKAMCPVDGTPLVDLALANVARITDQIAVNVHHGRATLEAHLTGRVHLSVEREALGTAGALGNLRSWIDGRDVLVHNVDAWHDADIESFVAGWDRSRPRLLTVERGMPADFGNRQYAGVALLPWSDIERLGPEPAGLYEVSWRDRSGGADLELVDHAGAFVDCGTPGRYLEANLAASGGASVVGAGAIVEGTLVGAVAWPGTHVWPHEVLDRAIRARQDVTVLVR